MPTYKIHTAMAVCRGYAPEEAAVEPGAKGFSVLECVCGKDVPQETEVYVQPDGPNAGLPYRVFKCDCGTAVFIPFDWPDHETVVAHDTSKAIFCPCTPLS